MEPQCRPCEAGYACEGLGLTAPDVECVEGYYCPEGTVGYLFDLVGVC